MGRNKRLNYGVVEGLHESGYSQTLIGKIYDTPNGHISKVLRGLGVKTRKRGEKSIPLSFDKLDKGLQKELRNEGLLERYQMVTGFDVNVTSGEEKLDWKSLDKKTKVEIILDKLESGMTTREAAKELGIAQSTLVKTKNSYLKEVGV